jgi:hypothetical protein
MSEVSPFDVAAVVVTGFGRRGIMPWAAEPLLLPTPYFLFTKPMTCRRNSAALLRFARFYPHFMLQPLPSHLRIAAPPPLHLAVSSSPAASTSFQFLTGDPSQNLHSLRLTTTSSLSFQRDLTARVSV